MRYIILIAIVGICTRPSYTQDDGTEAPAPAGPEEMDNDSFIADFDELGYTIACEWMALTDSAKLKLNLNRAMNYEDATKLTFLNKGRNLQENMLVMPEDIEWKRDLINIMWTLYQEACPKEYVYKGYMNIMRELVMIYLNSVEPRATPDTEVWNAIKASLNECAKKQYPPYNFTSNGLMISKLIVSSTDASGGTDTDDTVVFEEENSGEGKANDEKMEVEISPQMENANILYNLDPIIDNLWQVFSHAWARCYRSAPSRELWGLRFKQLFFRDFLVPLEKRWKNPGDVISYLDYIVGDFDVVRMQSNIPYCTQAAYVNPRGTHMESQLVRPIKLAEIERGVSRFQNTKV